MRRCIIYYLIILLTVCRLPIHAQDPHFSQYFSSPLSFNPALTGYFDGTHRAAFNVRNQWISAGEPYLTGTVSFDTKILRTALSGNDKWGVGLSALFDRSAEGIFNNSYVAVSTGFNKGLDAEGMQSIGIGVQASYARNSIDFSRITYNNQFNGNGYDIMIPSGESINSRSVSYIDLNAGLLYNYRDENDNQFSIGGSIYHILQPSRSYFSGNNQPLKSRITMHAGANIAIGIQDQLFVSTHIMRQNGASEVVIGGAYGVGFGDQGNYLYFGTWFRLKDAVYPYLGLRTGSYQLGLSYDVTSSDLKKAKRFNSSGELSIIYFFNKNTNRGIPCFF